MLAKVFLKDVAIIAITPTIVWPQLQGRNTALHPSAENWIKELLSMALLTKARPNFHHSQYFQSGSFRKLLILIHQRVDRVKTRITEI